MKKSGWEWNNDRSDRAAAQTPKDPQERPTDGRPSSVPTASPEVKTVAPSQARSKGCAISASRTPPPSKMATPDEGRGAVLM